MEASDPIVLFYEIMQAARLPETGDAVESILQKLNVFFQGVSDLLVLLHIFPITFGSDGALGHSRVGASPSSRTYLQLLWHVQFPCVVMSNEDCKENRIRKTSNMTSAKE
ncbi:hypothetical protein JVT61DRAFT_9018 [Boletus reticuloceps]|uniref:Uncharacterized protein n=1 Tax=Boletus reticuloceps TaxID=495285 RepID=A0A8I2YHC2_9AGAM|nr:hypothetical protein JVT61DRAFT_9018 [Boletus reticuloceps]